MDIQLIAARSLNNVIGNDSEIPWRVKGEQKLFKEITMDSVLIMGRKTYESIGRPLPGRITIIISRNPGYKQQGCRVAGNLQDAISLASEEMKPIFIAGGGQIYAEALPLTNQVHLTTVQCEAEGNIFFPEFSASDYKLLKEERFESNIDYIYQHFIKV